MRAEADVSFGNLDTTVRDGNYITEGGTISALGTVRARLGFAMGRFMPYVTGGLMWDRLKQSQECPDPAGVPFGWCRPANGYAPYNLSKTETNIGWTLGGKPEQTEVLLVLARTDDLIDGKPVLEEFPGGYKRVTGEMKRGIAIARFKFVQPGSPSGMAFDGLVHVNGRWVLIPRPWIGLGSRSPAPLASRSWRGVYGASTPLGP